MNAKIASVALFVVFLASCRSSCPEPVILEPEVRTLEVRVPVPVVVPRPAPPDCRLPERDSGDVEYLADLAGAYRACWLEILDAWGDED